MSRSLKKPALTAAITGSLLLSASAFASTPLTQGYLLGAAPPAATDKAKEGGCGGKHGEGRCGMEQMDSNKDSKVSKAEFTTAHKQMAEDMFAKVDANKDGFINADEMKAHHAKMGEGKCGEGKCGEGKCGADKMKGGEGKCGAEGMKTGDGMKTGEGKCGEGKCGATAPDAPPTPATPATPPKKGDGKGG